MTCSVDDCGSDDWDDPGLALCSMDCSCGFDDCCSSALKDEIFWFSLIISEMVSFNFSRIADMQVLTNWSIFEEGVELSFVNESKDWFGRVAINPGGGGGGEDVSSLLFLFGLEAIRQCQNQNILRQANCDYRHHA